MAVREVLRMPHPALKRPAAPCSGRVDVERVVADLLDTMAAAPRCVGLAAPQIGEPVRIAVVDVSGHPKATTSAGLLVLVDPVVVEQQGSAVAREGCLSVPSLTADVRRAERVVVEAHAPSGAALSIAAAGFEARCLLHEVDHLDGILFLDRVESANAVFARRSYG